jgi:hypothetical protein
MKNCTHCVHADWKRTAAGKLHPSGDGRCTKVVKLPKLPEAFYFTTEPRITGGIINRREEFKEDCVYFAYKKD